MGSMRRGRKNLRRRGTHAQHRLLTCGRLRRSAGDTATCSECEAQEQHRPKHSFHQVHGKEGWGTFPSYQGSHFLRSLVAHEDDAQPKTLSPEPLNKPLNTTPRPIGSFCDIHLNIFLPQRPKSLVKKRHLPFAKNGRSATAPPQSGTPSQHPPSPPFIPFP
jgi:hypothetical protein